MPAANPGQSPENDKISDYAKLITPAESVEYSKQLIESLKEIADRQGHKLLGQLLGLAAQEAQAILKDEV